MLPIKRQKHSNQRRNIKVIHPERETALIHVILLNKAFRVVSLLFLAATVLPVVVYLMVFSREIGPLEYDRNQVGTCGHLKRLHVSCGIQNITQDFCLQRGCCFSEKDGCYHSLPSRHQYFNPSYITPNLAMELQPLRQVTPLGVPALPRLQLAINPQTNARVRLYVWNPAIHRNPVEAETIRNDTADTQFIYRIFQPVIYAEFRRRVDQSLLMTTSRGPLITAENFLEWSFFLGSDNLFGLGDLHLKPGFKAILLNNETTSAIPVILAYNATSRMFHGIYLSAPYPVEVEITESYLVIVRAIFDMSFHVDLVCGPTISEVLTQLWENSGQISTLPNWFYGFHICDTNTTRNLTESMNEMLEMLDTDQIQENPFDSHCIREHLLWMANDSEGLPDEVLYGVEKLREAGKKFILPMTALLEANLKGKPFQEALDRGLLMRHPTLEEPYVGRMGNISVVYVDWVGSNGDTLTEWLRNCWPANFSADGLLLQSNWMRDESEGGKTPSSFPYVSQDMVTASNSIAPWLIRQSDTVGNASIFTHNLMASTQIEVVRSMASDTFIISESSLLTNVPIFNRNVSSTWAELRNQVRRTMGRAVSGVHFSSANICGDDENLPEELCVRWYQFASLSPIYRVSSSKAPSKFTRFAQRLIRTSTMRRYSLFAYMKTIVSAGRPLMTPMFYEFPELVADTENLTHQVLVGPSLLFAPVLMSGAQYIDIFAPCIFYEIGGGQQLIANKWTQLSVVEADVPLFIRAGHIIPLHRTMNAQSLMNVTTDSAQLCVALGPLINGTMNATGEMFVDDKQTITFTAILRMQWLQFQLLSHPKISCSNNTSVRINGVKIYGSGASDDGVHTLSLDLWHNLCLGNLNFITSLPPSIQ
ncbi:lysosomal alpha-glucosidase-like [Phlebotomus papatasi]|uniref:lysosomal alpha-glucosidase-like n=1 Tax=Phlebotomus papatasi TaxID=29031 RepID=UPI0024839E3F|nr:lysosomal alpha-glucosidase-like [Phlebotomus papatasi]XP_055700293.1 lysosomal alpha-glucosidase-like [Phlebotomus papatasi]XP_055700294.1 lysosomal alpha-glucosidase-like [Phlebotomus papatasi]XP_055700295.1 lysosomal alpha-glucosidase-like [Phlebotomus papatasi]XP_055700296.1 lysosomal alpha-glucosidase-like [Phlebotomus papatasi]XP_055700297.1 lysosomal alpha-glucosidase-like [Phlebotomus papatasi]